MTKILFISFSLMGLFLQCSNKTQAPTAIIDDSNASELDTGSIKDISFPEGVVDKIEKTEEEWKTALSDHEYYVLREKGTERPFTSKLLKNKEDGIYVCKACQLPLFDAKTKFKSGTGWPSFYTAIDSSYITEDTDYELGYARTELTCARCGGHLGHVFPDGPQPTGLRYCINGVSLDFVKQ